MKDIHILIILVTSFRVSMTNRTIEEVEQRKDENNLVFKDIKVNSKTIELQWRSPFFPLRTLLMYGASDKNLLMVQLKADARNFTINNLEPGTTYKVIIQVYYNSANLQNITKEITTLPIFMLSGNVKIEMKVLLKKTKEMNKRKLKKSILSKVKELLKEFKEIVRNVNVYSLRNVKDSFRATLYVSVQSRGTRRIFQKMKNSLRFLGATKIGFSFKIFQSCCSPFYFHHFDEQLTWSKDHVINLNVIPSNKFVSGKCGNAIDLTHSDVTVETRQHQSLGFLTMSLNVKLRNVKGLQPIISAVNYNTQMRLEVQEGRLVWMFYNIGNKQGFIIQTSTILQIERWMHILVDYDSTSGVGRIFVDAVLQKKALSDVVLTSNWIFGLRIGNYFSGGFNYKLNGYLDDLQLFSCTMTQDLIDMISLRCGKFSCQTLTSNKNLAGPTMRNEDTIKNTQITKLKSRLSRCNSVGTLNEVVGKNVTSQCYCKVDVIGELCDTCKNGTFGLNKDHNEGCIPCFCNGMTTDCRSATNLHATKIVLNANDITSFTLQTIFGEVVVNDDMQHDWSNKHVTYLPKKKDSFKKVLYWTLPSRYCGDKGLLYREFTVTSYGGTLNFTTSFLSRPSEKVVSGVDVVLKGKNIVLHYTEDEDPLPGQKNSYSVPINEKFWRRNGRNATREEMLTVLINVNSILLRAVFSTEMIKSTLHKVSLQVNDFKEINSHENLSHMVEECKCPPQYSGTSCQHCNKGFAKKNGTICKQCQCNGHSSDCAGDTGLCLNCQHFTTGVNCEKCLPGYYGDPRSGREDTCRPCPCPLTIKSNQFSSTCELDGDGEARCDACQVGYKGRNCQRCTLPYQGDPTKPGDSCKIPKESKCKDCDTRGSIDSTCDKTNGQCVCKKNVIGKKCTSCIEGTFNLESSNIDGCSPCWCSAVSSTCISSRYYRRLITISDVPTNKVKVTNFDESLEIKEGFYYNHLKKLVLTNVKKLPNTTLFWKLPNQFTGKKLTAYGGSISYKVSYDAEFNGKPYIATDIKLVGRYMTLVHQGNLRVINRQVKTMKVILKEEYWTSLTGDVVKRSDFLAVLVELRTVFIRATYNTKTKISSVSNVIMTDAVPFDLQHGTAKQVERCRCPLSYTGLSCESCSKGYTRFIVSHGAMKCQKCQCNGHSNQCDAETGACINCLHHTQGTFCHECIDGYYGNPIGGSCKKCACPMTIPSNLFSRKCSLDADGDYTCQLCDTGYNGRKCEKCASGYTGNPLTPGGTCQKSSKRYTAAPSVTVSPERRLDRVRTSAVFKCTVHGEAPLTISWSRIDGRPLPKRAIIQSDGNTKTLIIRHLRVIDDTQTYICSGRNDYGLSTAQAGLVVVGHSVQPIRLHVSPISMRIENGAIARFYCKDDSETTSTIRWLTENPKLPKEANVDRGVLTIKNVQRRHSGVYTCVGSNQHSTDRVNVKLQVGVVVPPKASVYPSYKTVDMGSQAEFRCSVTGYPIPTIEWERTDGRKIPRNAKISGNYLRLKKISIEDEGSYKCIATNRGGKVSRRGLLYVRELHKIPKIRIAKTLIRVKQLEEVEVKCSVDATSASIKWQKKIGNLPANSEVKDGVLKIREVKVADGGVYICNASNLYGEDTAEITIDVLTEQGLSPKVSIIPDFGNVVQGTTLTIHCNVSGEPSPSVLWSKPNGLLTNNHVLTGSKLKILRATPQDGGTYVCSGKNEFGQKSVMSVISVERRVAPKIAIDQKHQRIYVGDSATFVCSVKTGIPKPTIFWKTSVGYRVPDNYIEDQADGSVALVFRKINKRVEGNYSCVALNVAGKDEDTVMLKVRGDPNVSLEPRGVYHVTIGDSIRIKCFGFGVPSPVVVFTFPTTSNLTVNNTSIERNKNMVDLQFIAKDNLSGKYVCSGSNRYGVKKDFIHIIVNKADSVPTCDIRPSNVIVRLSSSVEITCIVTGTPNPNIYWTKDDDEHSIISKQHKLIIHSAEGIHGGKYHCHAKNRKGRSHCSTLVELVEPASVTITPEHVVARKAHSFVLKCKSSGFPKPIIEWMKVDEKQIPSSLLVSDTEIVAIAALPQHAGMYACKGRNVYGSHVSYANVSVVEPPSVEANGSTVLNVQLNTSITLNCIAHGYPLPSIKWIMPTKSSGEVSNSGLLLVKHLTKYDQGQYKCQANNIGGFAEETFVVLIIELPKVYISGSSSFTAMAGTSHSLKCIGNGIPKPSLQWFKIGEVLPANSITSNGILHFQQLRSSNSGRYRCVGENMYGKVVAEVQLSVVGAPMVSVSPKSFKANMKESSKFFCNVTGSPTPAVSWKKVDGEMPEYHFVKNGYLTIPNVKYEDSGLYICRAENTEGVAEQMVELSVNEFIPRFNSSLESVIIYDVIRDSLHETDIEISIRATSSNGLLLYNGEPEKDFISLGIIDSHVIFRYDLGSGPAIIRSSKKIVLHEWITVKAGRKAFSGFLHVEGSEKVHGKSEGRFNGLNLKNELFVGGHYDFDKIEKQTSHDVGFSGCISFLVINRKHYDFALSLKTNKVYACDICTKNSCFNNGDCTVKSVKKGYICKCAKGYVGEYCEQRIERCYPHACNLAGKCYNNPKNGYFCKCALGMFGQFCEQGQSITIPSFKKDSFIAYKIPHVVSDSFKLALTFKTLSLNDSLVFIVSSHFTMLRVEIVAKKIILRYDLGNGEVVVKSAQNISIAKWIKVYVEQNRQHASLRVNKNQAVKGASNGNYFNLRLNTRSRLYLGGDSGSRSVGLHGCIQQLVVNDIKVDLVNDFVESKKFSSCYRALSPCLSYPCLHNSTCVSNASGKFKCHCTKQYKGTFCENKIKRCGKFAECENNGKCLKNRFSNDLYCSCLLGWSGTSCIEKAQIDGAISLDEASYLIFPKNLIRNVVKNVIEVSFRTSENDGLLFWYGVSQEISPDFLLIGIKMGKLDVQFQLGSGEAVAKSTTRLNDGRWHTVKLIRSGASLVFKVDGNIEKVFRAPGVNKNLDVYSVAYLGGSDDIWKLSRRKYKRGFRGCIRDFRLDNKSVDFIKNALTGFNVRPCHM